MEEKKKNRFMNLERRTMEDLKIDKIMEREAKKNRSIIMHWTCNILLVK